MREKKTLVEIFEIKNYKIAVFYGETNSSISEIEQDGMIIPVIKSQVTYSITNAAMTFLLVDKNCAIHSGDIYMEY